MQRIDLSMTIRNHWRWIVKQTFHHDYSRGDDFQTSILEMGAHAFTHVDTPLHCKQGEATLDQMDIYSYSGPSVIIDISYILANEPIRVEDLQNHCPEFNKGEIILLKTCWDEKYHPDTKEYWVEAPYVTEEAAIWLREKSPKAVGFDFPQDYPLKLIDNKHLILKELTTHKHLLYEGILHIEYLCNMKQVLSNRIELIALPLKLEGFEGGPARVMAIDHNL